MTERGKTVQTLNPRWTHTERQAEVMATTGNEEDFAAFNMMIRKGMALLEAKADPCMHGTRMLLKQASETYFIAAQAFRMLHNDRSWEDYFPWMVFRARSLGHKTEWLDWAAEKYGADYETFDVNPLIAEWRKSGQDAA